MNNIEDKQSEYKRAPVSLVTDDIKAEVEAVTRDVVCPEAAAGPDDEEDGPLFTGGSG